MKAKLFTVGMLFGIAMFASGCTVKCRFEKWVDVGKGQFEKKECVSKIIACMTTKQDCRPLLEVECEDSRVYRGPYRVDSKNDKLIYTATQWHGDDPLKVVTGTPVNDGDRVDSKLLMDDDASEGACSYHLAVPMF